MGKGRFSDMQALNSVVSDAALTVKAPIKEKAEKLNRMVYNISGELYTAIDESGESFSNFAKRAMMRLAREEGILK